jgi:8-oxo-dGTP pyrophosphatase MutT (NUDIX family)
MKLQNPDQAQGTCPSSHLTTVADHQTSILLISPSNQILLLHRVRTSSSFPSAHVFPGGNLSASQDGDIPSPKDPKRHIDGPAYRLGAIRECFEESGILLAKRDDGSGALLDIPEEMREKARKDIHAGRMKFGDWVKSQGGVVDTGMFYCNPFLEQKDIRLTFARIFITIYTLDYAYQYSETIYNSDVYILPPSRTIIWKESIL